MALATLLIFCILTLWTPAYWPTTVFQVSVFALGGATLWRRRASWMRLAYPAAPLCFAVLWGGLQLITRQTAYAFETRRAMLYWTTLLTVFLTGTVLFREAEMRQRFRLVLVVFTSVVSVLAILQSITSAGQVFWLFPTDSPYPGMGPMLSRNHYAAWIEVVLPMALYEALSMRRNSWRFAAMAAAMYASVIASGSRAGCFLTTAEVVTVIAVMRLRGNGQAVGRAALRLAAFLALFAALAGWEAAADKLRDPAPMAVRRELNLSSLHMIAEHPLFGVGLGTWATVYPRYAITDTGAVANQAHDDWLQWTAEGGLPFGLMMATLFVWCFRKALRNIWGLGVIAVFLHAAVDYPFSRPTLASWPMVVVAMLAAPGRRETLVPKRVQGDRVVHSAL